MNRTSHHKSTRSIDLLKRPFRCRTFDHDAASCAVSHVGDVPCRHVQGMCRATTRTGSRVERAAGGWHGSNASLHGSAALAASSHATGGTFQLSPASTSHTPRRASIALLTAAAMPYRGMHASFYASRRCYAERFPEGVEVVYAWTNGSNKELPTAHWEKVVALREYLPRYDWVAYSDADTVMVGTFPLQELVAKAERDGVHLIMPREQDQTKSPKWCFSNFAMIIRNSAIGRRFVDLWWSERTHLCGFFDQCSCWRALVRVMHGKHERALPPWRFQDMAPFEAAINRIAGRPPPADGLEDVQVRSVLFSGALFMQMKMFWYRKLYCPRDRLTTAFSRALVVHSQRALKFPRCHTACTPCGDVTLGTASLCPVRNDPYFSQTVWRHQSGE